MSTLRRVKGTIGVSQAAPPRRTKVHGPASQWKRGPGLGLEGPYPTLQPGHWGSTLPGIGGPVGEAPGLGLDQAQTLGVLVSVLLDSSGRLSRPDLRPSCLLPQWAVAGVRTLP